MTPTLLFPTNSPNLTIGIIAKAENIKETERTATAESPHIPVQNLRIIKCKGGLFSCWNISSISAQGCCAQYILKGSSNPIGKEEIKRPRNRM